MTKVLITGSKSYIGTSFAKWLSRYGNAYATDRVSIRDSAWRNMSLSNYDAVLHTAALVHAKDRRPEKFYAINRDLAIDVARKAKQEGVQHFLFLSTMAVYGIEKGHIMPHQVPNPKSHYAKSKYQAELALDSLSNENFTVSIIRPPMVYGPCCPGNYRQLADIARRARIFPDISNKRSMIYIDNLCEFLRIAITKKVGGTLFPQNSGYVNTSMLASLIAEASGKQMRLSKTMGSLVRALSEIPGPLKKAFGSLTYDQSMSAIPASGRNLDVSAYETVSFVDSVIATEDGKLQDG